MKKNIPFLYMKTITRLYVSCAVPKNPVIDRGVLNDCWFIDLKNKNLCLCRIAAWTHPQRRGCRIRVSLGWLVKRRFAVAGLEF